MDDSVEREDRKPKPSPNTEGDLQKYIPYPYQSLDAEGKIIAVNEAWLDLLGRKRESVIGKWFGEILTEKSRNRFQEEFPTLKKSGSVSGIEFEILRGDELTNFVSFDGQAEFDEGGEFVRSHCQFKDITERKQYETFIQNSPDIILLHDETGEAKYVSPAVEREMGYDPESLTGRNPFNDVHPDDRDRMMEAFSRILSKPDSIITEEYRIQNADGSYVWIESRGQNLIDGEGINGILLNSRVIDERKEYEKQLERQNERLEDFASVLSHDLRNPLNVAQGRLGLASEECDSEHLDAVEPALDRMESLIEDLLTLAREGKAMTEREPVDISALLNGCWANVDTGDASIELDIDRTIQADESRLQQVFENLFRNAVEHGGDDVTVTVGELEDGFYVEDDGPGIPEEDREQIFQAGYSKSDEGTGFGLSIVKEIIEVHNWDIRVSEGSKGGGRFEITGVEFTAE